MDNTTNATNAISLNSKQKERNSNGPSVIVNFLMISQMAQP